MTLPDRVGVQLHLRKEGTPYYDLSRVTAALSDLGVKHVRDSFNVGFPTQNAQIRQVADTCGVKFTLTVKYTDPIDGFVSGVQALGDCVVAVEGVNEWDNTGRTDWANELRTHHAAFYAAVKAAMPDMPVLAPALADPTKASTLGAVSCDYGNSHAYPNGAPSDSWISTCRTGAGTVSGGKPLVVTETGYTNSLSDPDVVYHHPVTEAVSGGYMPTLVSTHLDAGAYRVFIYELFDQLNDGTDVENGFGLLRNDGTPKAAYAALRNLLTANPQVIVASSGKTTIDASTSTGTLTGWAVSQVSGPTATATPLGTAIWSVPIPTAGTSVWRVSATTSYGTVLTYDVTVSASGGTGTTTGALRPAGALPSSTWVSPT